MSENTLEKYLIACPDVIKNIIVSDVLNKEILYISERFGLAQEKISLLKNEVLFVLIGMEPRKDFVQNIKNNVWLDQNVAQWLAEDIEKNIFSKVKDELDEMERQIESAEESTATKNVGNDFEQIIANQAKAMQPARDAITSEAGRPTQNKNENGTGRPVYEAPDNLPTEEEKPRVIHNYIGSDPYREPIE